MITRELPSTVVLRIGQKKGVPVGDSLEPTRRVWNSRPPLVRSAPKATIALPSMKNGRFSWKSVLVNGPGKAIDG
jgi:hypothetical protein